MTTVYRKSGPPLVLDLQNPFGEGGEAIVIDLGGGKVLKYLRRPDDPFYVKPGDPQETKRNQEGARRRLALYQKKLPDWPKGLPSRIVGPIELDYDKPFSNGKPTGLVCGFEMPMVEGNVMADFYDIDFREANGIDNNHVRDFHLDWLDTLERAHLLDFVFGDVNPQNEIVTTDGKVYIIDADAGQFGKYMCQTFTARFVDPLICKSDQMVMCRPHSKESDLYSFAVIYWLTTLYVGPWEGVLPLKTKDAGAAGVRSTERALRRIPVTHPEVLYPKWATHYSALPDDMLDFYERLLVKDERGKSMRKLLEQLRWTTCTKCGFYHARANCPSCAAPTRPEFIVATITKDLEIERVVDLPAGAKLLAFKAQQGPLKYLYHYDGEFHREFGSIGLKRGMERGMRADISGDRTLISMMGRVGLFAPHQKPVLVPAERYRGKIPQFAANSQHFVYLRDGQLVRESTSREGDYIDETLAHQTQLWLGEKFGLAFYFVSGLQKAKVFGIDGSGSVPVSNMPQLSGTLLRAICYFSKSRAWLFVTTEEGGKTFNTCFVVKPNGECSSSLMVEQGDPDHPWLSGFIHLGKCAALLSGKNQKIECLLAATDDGVVGIMDNKGKLIQIMKFDGTAGHVLPTDRIFYHGVLYRIRGTQVHTVKTK